MLYIVYLERCIISQQMVFVLGEAVGFVAHLLEPAQGRVVAGESYRSTPSLDRGFLYVFG